MTSEKDKLRSLFSRGVSMVRNRRYSGATRETIVVVVKGILSRFFVPQVLPRFKHLADATTNIDDAVALAYSFNLLGISIRPSQCREEVVDFLRIVEDLKPRLILEIGTWKGGMTFLLTRAAAPKSRIVTIDLPGGIFGTGYPDWMIPLFKSFPREGQKIDFVLGDSHDSATLNEVCNRLESSKIDVLFVDGDHSYEGVKKDFEMYGPLVRRGGIVAFHDIFPVCPNPAIEVPRFWNEIKLQYAHREIMNHRRYNGIGVLFV